MSKSLIYDKTSNYYHKLIESLQDREEAMVYLEVALEEYELDGDTNAFMLALKHVVEAYGGVGWLAQETGLDRVHLYRVLSNKGNPRFFTLDRILKALGFRLSIATS
ncbi:putative addiction module antidote protein [Thiotrichales bacterium 19X7-9]|nr:putative addiction module antidote protein [Thiotrichales bacterium 19X7-9]